MKVILRDKVSVLPSFPRGGKNGGMSREAGLQEKQLTSLPGSDPRKVALTTLLIARTIARQGWIADRLVMRSAANVSQQVRRARTN
jgi:hypothetical protein